MATNQFNATCSHCGKFRPRCARVQMRMSGKATMYHSTVLVLCDECRRGPKRGSFRLASASPAARPPAR